MQRPPWTTATLLRVDGDSIWYRTTDGEVSRIATADAHVRRPTGTNRRTEGIVIGTLVGATLGALVGYAQYQPEYYYQGDIGGAILCSLNDCNVPQSKLAERY